MNNLILFTNRSGSTVLADVLSYAHNTLNLGEGLHSMIRPYNFNYAAHKKSELYRIMSTRNMALQHNNVRTRGSNFIGFFEEKKERMEMLKHTNERWTVKETTDKLLIDVNFVEYCCQSGINVYMTHRRDIVGQFVSKINARYRAEIAHHKSPHFIFTNRDPYSSYDQMVIPFHWLYMYTNVFLEQLMMWRIMYEKFKPYIKIVSFEDHVKAMNFEHIGISKEVIEKYKSEAQHLVPTPANVTNVVVQDDHPSNITGAWDQSLYHVGRHQYLVDI